MPSKVCLEGDGEEAASEVNTYEKYATDKTPLLDFYFFLLFQNYLSSCHIAPQRTPEDVESKKWEQLCLLNR